MQKIITFLSYNDQAEEAVNLYTSLFKNSKIGKVLRYSEAGPGTPGSVLTIDFELAGQSFVAMNGGSHFKFTDGISLSVSCDDQAEVDRYWNALTADGGKEIECSWLVDKFGVSWQIVPKILPQLLTDPDREKADRVMQAMMKMKKIIVADLEAAAAG